MKYILLIDSRVVEVIPEVDPNFLDIPITERYARTVLSQCIIVPDDTETPIGYVYDSEAGTFSAPPLEPEIPPDQPIIPGVPIPQQDTDALLVDHEYRLTLLELGVK